MGPALRSRWRSWPKGSSASDHGRHTLAKVARRSNDRPRYRTGDRELDTAIAALVEKAGAENADLIFRGQAQSPVHDILQRAEFDAVRARNDGERVSHLMVNDH